MYIECAIDVQIKHNIDTFPDSLGYHMRLDSKHIRLQSRTNRECTYVDPLTCMVKEVRKVNRLRDC